MHFLEFNNVSFSYDSKLIINNYSFYVDKGEILMIKGRSGIGKSTLLRLISGLEEVSTGEIFLDGIKITNEKIEKRNIGYLFQEFALFPHLNVYDNISFGLSKLKKEEKKEKVTNLLELIELIGYEKRYPHELSGGEKQRVALARSLAITPKLLLLDEPFSSLNIELREKLRQDLKGLLKKIGITTIIVSHDLDDSIIADRLINME
ncbi:ABC transporter ATP-binding protein [Streptobacillus moniliformis]|uniref:ABC transporter related protein n=1 Tax=Streptobacillus moniliformis (strain ATCC 14647 / DSM 12112 / NCTC 10651 / 9901) TaxID=519441 RepID=D1AYR3_STRM9|nr:ABC transporter ATP-binding protein [Streptobacillus moniliformis]ACZ01439.1 ABC transporter related protein [Streptobacillus moniliformis DSM 12112]AVL43553.1 ABC transporter [Streptobacillus moniliformis]QXW66122.1 ABC transporter ATP-binding protein [Streptobacillus moniliformis]SQA13399.1 Fe(3+) ions import ATP-binding protein FbpC [Streptobacillus moniliformis]